MDTDTAVMETKPCQNWIWLSLEDFGLLGSHTSWNYPTNADTSDQCYPCRSQGLDHWEMFIEFPLDASMGQLCRDVSNMDQWLGMACKIDCNILDQVSYNILEVCCDIH